MIFLVLRERRATKDGLRSVPHFDLDVETVHDHGFRLSRGSQRHDRQQREHVRHELADETRLPHARVSNQHDLHSVDPAVVL